MIYRQMGLLDFIFRRKPSVPTAVPPTDPPAATPALRLLNPGLSRAERKFLSQFTAGFTFEPQHGEHWDQVLPLPRAKQISRFLSAGLVEPADLATKLNRHLNGAELKALLRERGLAVSGRKDTGIGRLIAADGTGAAALVSDIEVYVCTAQGKQIAEEFVAAEKDESRRARELSLRRLRANDLHGALMGVYEFERQQVFSRGVGCDWSRDPSADETVRLRHVFEARPKILKDVPEHAPRSVPMHRLVATFELWQMKLALAAIHRKTPIATAPLPLFGFPADEEVKYWPRCNPTAPGETPALLARYWDAVVHGIGLTSLASNSASVLCEPCEDGSPRVRPISDAMALFGAAHDKRPRDAGEKSKGREAMAGAADKRRR